MLQTIPYFLCLSALQGGLVARDTKLGSGPKAVKGDALAMLYKGTLRNGTVFDQNLEKAPFVFTLGAGQVIEGWDKGLEGMRVGGKRHLEIPAQLAYKDRAVGSIPANSPLVFDVELLRIDKPNSTPTDEITVLKKGTGRPAKDGDKVKVLYKGMFLNGVKFDSSFDHLNSIGKPDPLPVTLGAGGVIPGFSQGIMGMKVGEKRKVVIPSRLGYGPRGAGGVIPPNSTLIFELTLVSIEK